LDLGGFPERADSSVAGKNGGCPICTSQIGFFSEGGRFAANAMG
jgi:hypothetical protein